MTILKTGIDTREASFADNAEAMRSLVADLRAALEAKDRAACGPVAPARGLYLMRVDYPSGDAQPTG